MASLASPAFVVALALLVLNDFALKPLFHNALTGKVSDFAGLFALTLFVATLWPRCARVAAWVIAAAFTLWKTSYAEPLIAAWNAMSPLAFGRTPDLTDLVALPMIPLAVWTAPRLEPWPLPRALQWPLALLAPLAFTATSATPHRVRSTMDVSSTAVIDAAALQTFFDEVAEEHGLRCSDCASLDVGRRYLRLDSERDRGPDELTVQLDSQRRQVHYAAADYGARKRDEVLALSEDIRVGMQQRFPGVTAIAFAEGTQLSALSATEFTIRVPIDGELSVETAEGAKRTLSSIVEAVVRTHGLLAEEDAAGYYVGNRFGAGPDDRELALRPSFASNATLRISVLRQTPNYVDLHEAINRDLAERLGAAFGPAVVTRRDF